MAYTNLQKMRTELNSPVDYSLQVGSEQLHLNPLLGKEIKVEYSGKINCTNCGVLTKKSFSGGYCYPCSQKLAEADMCILKPETCHFAKGTCRDEKWAQSHCMQPHYIYLANSSGLKVGITRQSQVPTRWIDQGAIGAIPLFRVKNRHQSGLVEVLLKDYVTDKTNWRKMLKNETEDIDLEEARAEIVDNVENHVDEHFEDIEFLEDDATFIEYPVLEYPEKIKSFSLDKIEEFSGVLKGIKGQYLIFDNGVFNVRRHTGYEVQVSL